jgi:hypothetical protein
MAGNKENPAINKASQLILLCKGQILKDYEKVYDGTYDPTDLDEYEKLFMKIFSIHWRKALLLHRITTIPIKDLNFIFSIEENTLSDVTDI